MEERTLYQKQDLNLSANIDDIQKANLWQWKERTSKTGKKFQQRYRKHIEEQQVHEKSTKKNADGTYDDPAAYEGKRTDNPDTYEAREKQWINSTEFAGLKDKLAYAVLYEGDYFDLKGHKIKLPERFKDVIKNHFHAKLSVRSLTALYNNKKLSATERKAFKEIYEKIKKRDIDYHKFNGLYQLEKVKYVNQKKKDLLKASTFIKKIEGYQNEVSKDNSSVDHLILTLNRIKRTLHTDLDPTIELTIDGKVQEIQFDDLLTRLNNTKVDRKKNTGIEKLNIKNLTDYSLDDFHKPDPKQLARLNSNMIYNRATKAYKTKHSADFDRDIFDEFHEHD